MHRSKRTLSIRVASTKQMVELMKALGELDANLIAESHPGGVKIRIYGSKDEVRDLIHKILALIDTNREKS